MTFMAREFFLVSHLCTSGYAWSTYLDRSDMATCHGDCATAARA